MRFSLRAMLALTFLVFLSLLAWRGREAVRRDESHQAQLQNDIQNLQGRLRFDQPALHQAILHTLDEYQSTADMRARAVAHFDVLKEKYSGIQSRGPDVLSFRSIPSLSTGGASPPVVFRLLVPAQRRTWLKFAVHYSTPSLSFPPQAEGTHDFLTESPFSNSGPFEIAVPPGDHYLSISIGHAKDDALPISISLNSEVLLQASFNAAGVSGAGWSSVSAPAQIDVQPDEPLPWLLTAKMNTPREDSQKRFGFSVWLGDSASNYASFPGE